MREIQPAEVRSFLLSLFADSLEARGVASQLVPDDYDLLTEGVIDSLGILEMVTAMEERFGFPIDFEDLDAEQMTILGPICRYVAAKSKGTVADAS